MDTPDKVRWAVRNFVSYLHLFLDDADTVWEDEAIEAEFLDGIKQITATFPIFSLSASLMSSNGVLSPI